MARNPETVIAILNTSDGEGILYDGIQEPDFHSALLEILGKSRRLRGDGGQLAGLRGKKFREILGKGEVELRSSVTRAQQSNSSIMFEDRFVLKLIRKLEEGLNPDEEIVRHLTEKVRFRQIPSFAGMIQYRKEGGDPITVGLLQEFVANQGDGWDFFLGQVSGYLDKILARAHEIGPPPEQSSELGSPLEGEKGEMAELIGEFGLHMTALLGQRTGELHEALARPSDNPAFSPEPFSLLYQRSIYQSVGSLVRKTFSLLRSRTDGLAEDESRLAAEVLSQQSSIRDRLERLLRKKISAAKIRVHGDYHLGQTLFTGKDFVILDFEGEPARPLGERRLKRSALRDVAGMIRSFHYVAHMALLHHRTEDMPLLQGWVLPWFNTLSGLFLTSYIETVRHAAFIPEDQEDLRTLLDVYLIEKAVYEIGYEMNNRPDWVSIPLRGLIHLMKDSS